MNVPSAESSRIPATSHDRVEVDGNNRRRVLTRAILCGTVAVTLLDALDGVTYFGLTKRFNPIQVLQYIASGAVGAGAFNGGLTTALVGLIIHVALATAFTSIFVLTYATLESVRRYAVPCGLVYGAIVWCFMNLLVLPHSGVPQSPLGALDVIHGLIGHALFVGLPAALAARSLVPPDAPKRMAA